MYIVITSQIISLGVTPAKLPISPLVGREYITLQNLGNAILYVGNTFVTANTANTGGLQLKNSDIWSGAYSNTVDIYGVIVTGSIQVLVQEGK